MTETTDIFEKVFQILRLRRTFRGGDVSFLQGDRKCPGPRSHNEREEADHGRLEQYLGLTNHPKVQRVPAIEAIEKIWSPGVACARFSGTAP